MSLRYYTVAEAVILTGYSPWVVRYKCKRGIWRVKPGRRPGRHYQIVASDVDAELQDAGGGELKW